MVQYMKVTSRLPAKRAQDKTDALTGADMGRPARVMELRAMVKANQYRMSPRKIAAAILARALSRSR
jgi:anti-sigma28 factor (negative regulator of flagellin synthesis)